MREERRPDGWWRRREEASLPQPLSPFYPTQPSDQATSRQNSACWCLDILERRRKEEGAVRL